MVLIQDLLFYNFNNFISYLDKRYNKILIKFLELLNYYKKKFSNNFLIAHYVRKR